MAIDLPTRDVIKAIYQQQYKKYGGVQPNGDDVKIRAALAWPRMMVTTGNGADIFTVAVSLMMGILNEKPFFEGNKRLGLSVALVTLRKNGWMLDISNAEIISLIKTISERQMTEGKVVDYFRQKSVPVSR